MANRNQDEKTKMNPVLWFFFAIIIPLAVALTITVVVLTIVGVDVAGWAKEKASGIPVVSSLVSKESKTAGPQVDEKTQEKLDAKNKQIDSLKKQVDELEGTVDSLEQDMLKQKNKEKSDKNAEKQSDDKTDVSASNGAQGGKAQATSAQNDPVKKMASSFKKMDAQQAALIVQDLSTTMAIDLMNELSTETRGQILQEMEPAKAADLTERFIKANTNKQVEQ